MEDYLSVSEFADLFNINRQTLHFYDQKGLFQPISRNPENHYRQYSHDQIARFSFITYLRTIGFSIDQIKAILDRGDIDSTMEQLDRQAQILMEHYREIFKIERIIQRKLKFVKYKLTHSDFDAVELLECPRKAYMVIGTERVLYENEDFYYYPTLVFYRRQEEAYEKVFAAYVSPDDLTEEYADRAHFIPRQTYLRFYHRGPYTEIPEAVARVRRAHSGPDLSPDYLCTNIIDQFLETDPGKFVTEIQIPLKNADPLLTV